MPEGPEVTIMVKQMSKFFKNSRLKDVLIHHKKYESKLGNKRAFYKSLPSKIKEISNKGKFVYMKLANGWSLGFTPGMTGHFWIPEKSKDFKTAEGYMYNYKYDHIELITSDGKVYFNDPRRFGHFYVFQNDDELNKKLKTLGPDLLKDLPKMSQADFNERLGRFKPNKNIAEALLDQKFIAGVGNYIRADALYEAKISPKRKIGSLTLNDKKRLKNALEKIGKNSFNAQKKGLHTYKFKIYGKTGAKQERDKLNRTIWWDPKRQI